MGGPRTDLVADGAVLVVGVDGDPSARHQDHRAGGDHVPEHVGVRRRPGENGGGGVTWTWQRKGGGIPRVRRWLQKRYDNPSPVAL